MSDTAIATLTAADLMSRELTTVRGDTPLSEAVRLMLDQGVSGLPVVGPQEELIGVLTEGDLLRRAETGTGKRRPRWISLFLSPAVLADEYVRENARHVADVMTRPPLATAAEDSPIGELVRLMELHQVKRIPILRGRQLVGMVSRADLLEALSAKLAGAPAKRAPDKVLRRRVRRALHELAGVHQRPQLAIHDGIVDLFWPLGSSDWERQMARVAVENTAGVKQVREHFLASA